MANMRRTPATDTLSSYLLPPFAARAPQNGNCRGVYQDVNARPFSDRQRHVLDHPSYGPHRLRWAVVLLRLSL